MIWWIPYSLQLQKQCARDRQCGQNPNLSLPPPLPLLEIAVLSSHKKITTHHSRETTEFNRFILHWNQWKALRSWSQVETKAGASRSPRVLLSGGGRVLKKQKSFTMASIGKLSIRGVRAFSPDDAEQVCTYVYSSSNGVLWWLCRRRLTCFRRWEGMDDKDADGFRHFRSRDRLAELELTPLNVEQYYRYLNSIFQSPSLCK